jgi:hypothetical protein
MKPFPVLILFALIIGRAAAQEPVQLSKAISFGGELAVPPYGLYSIGSGMSVKLELPIASPVSISMTAGFTSFFYRGSVFSNYGNSGVDVFVPLKIGAKYYFIQNVYAEAELGEALELTHNKDNLLAFSIGPGFVVPAGRNGLDISFRYEDWQGEIKQTALRVAYRFGW